MKRGYRLCYYKNIPTEDIEKIIHYFTSSWNGVHAGGIKEWFSSKNSYKCRTKSGAFFRRGNFGLLLDDEKYVFRRLSHNRRVFGVCPIDILEGKNEPINTNQCMCGEHRAGQKVRIKGGFKESDFVTYYEEGEIKG